VLARLRLEYVIGGQNMAFEDDMVVRSKKFPGNQVHDFYRIIMRDIMSIGEPTTTRALHGLGWIKHAKEPMRTEVLLEAIGASSMDAMLRPCMSLVVLSENGYLCQFSHTTTVTEFLDNPKNFADLGAELPSPLDLAKQCLNYFNSEQFASLRLAGYTTASTLPGFGGYVVRFWAEHVRQVDDILSQDLSYFKFLASKTKRKSLLKLNRQAADSTILLVAAENGLPGLCRSLLAAKARSIIVRGPN
jgi:hypothetical protein